MILGLDWLLFSGTAVTVGLATPVTALLGFALGGIATAACQRYAASDSWPASLGKGLLAGVAVGVPFPILGTFVGGVVLASSGLSSFKRMLPKD
ncbi:MAG: phosphoribosylaminoimidazole carboxylase [bacterium]|nr:phosphoribosylaminoimidazole carboxylase [bacterium]